MDLTGKTALVTGASRGIGLAIAKRLAQEPLARLYVGVRDLDRYEPIEAEAGEVRPLRVELSSFEAIEGLGAELDEVDLLVNNAGQFLGGLLEKQDMRAVYEMAQVNLLGTIHLTQRVLPAMLKRDEGKIVNQASVVGYAHFPGTTTYSATKAGVHGFTQALRRELEETGVSVLELATGGVDTDMLDKVADELEGHTKTEGWDQYTPDEWAERVIDAIRSDDEIVGPGGKAALAKLASRGPGSLLDAAASRGFSRDPD